MRDMLDERPSPGSRLAPAFGLLFASMALLGCSDRPEFAAGAPCSLSTDCDAPLVCRLELCRSECRDSRDCEAGFACVFDANGLGVCQVADDLGCVLSSQCAAPLVCREARCTNACSEDRDCPSGQACREDGEGVRGCVEDDAVSCLLNSECASPLVCAVDLRCREECQTSRDCFDGDVCDDLVDPNVCVAAP